MKKCSYCGKEYPDELSFCPLDQDPLHQPPGTPAESTRPQEACPLCGSQAGFTPVVEFRKPFSFPLLFTGGLIAILFRNAGRERFVRCHTCDKKYGIRTPFSKFARVLFWLCMAPAVIYALFFLIKSVQMLISN